MVASSWISRMASAVGYLEQIVDTRKFGWWGSGNKGNISICGAAISAKTLQPPGPCHNFQLSRLCVSPEWVTPGGKPSQFPIVRKSVFHVAQLSRGGQKGHFNYMDVIECLVSLRQRPSNQRKPNWIACKPLAAPAQGWHDFADAQPVPRSPKS